MGRGLYSAQVSKAEEEKGEDVLGYPLHQSICTGRHTESTPELFHSRPGTVSRVASEALQARAAVHGMVRLATVVPSSGQMLLQCTRSCELLSLW
jgi:hypothetical protein